MNTKAIVGAFVALRNMGASEDAIIAAMDATPIDAILLWQEVAHSIRIALEDKAVADVERLAKEEETRQRAEAAPRDSEPALPAPAPAAARASDASGEIDDGDGAYTGIPRKDRVWRSVRGKQAPRWVEEEVARMDGEGYGPSKIYDRFNITYTTQKAIIVRLAKERIAAEEAAAKGVAPEPIPSYHGRGVPPHIRAKIADAMRLPSANVTQIAQRYYVSDQTVRNIMREDEEERKLRKAAQDAPAPPVTPAGADKTKMPDWAVEG